MWFVKSKIIDVGNVFHPGSYEPGCGLASVTGVVWAPFARVTWHAVDDVV